MNGLHSNFLQCVSLADRVYNTESVYPQKMGGVNWTHVCASIFLLFFLCEKKKNLNWFKLWITFQSSSAVLLQLLSVTGNQLEKTEKFWSEGMASDIIKARKEVLILLYHLIRHKFNNSNSSQSKDQKQNKVNEFFNIQYGKLKPLVLHSK